MSCLTQLDELFRTSPFPVSEEVSEADAAPGCSDSLDSQPSHMQQKNEDCRPSQASEHEEQHDSIDVSVDPGVTGQSVIGKEIKRASKAIKLKDEHLDLQCRWRDCDYRTCLLDHFVLHISLHIPQAERRLNENKEGTGSIGVPLDPLQFYEYMIN
jgi:hypothetical protein